MKYKNVNLFFVVFNMLLVPPVLLAAEEQKTNREPQFETDEVQVWKTTIYPKQPLKMHRHENKRILVALTDVDLLIKNDKGETHRMEIKKHTARLFEADKPGGELHGDINESDHPMEVMVIQFKDKDKKE